MFSSMCACARECIPMYVYVCTCKHAYYVCVDFDYQCQPVTVFNIQPSFIVYISTQVLFAWRMATTQGTPPLISWDPTLQSGRESLLHTFQIWKIRTTQLTLQKVTN